MPRLKFEKTPVRVLERRRYRLKQAGFHPEEAEALIVLPLYDLRRLRVLKGRRIEIKNYMRDLRMTRTEAIDYAREEYLRKGFKILAADYIEYYYEED